MKMFKWLIFTILFIFVIALPSAAFAGEVIKLTGDIEIQNNEEINGDVVALTGDIKILGKVNGNVTAFKGDIYLEDNAVVNGDLVAITGKVIKKSENVTINGKISEITNRNFNRATDSAPSVQREVRYINNSPNWGGGVIIQLLGLAALTLIGLSLFGKSMENMHLWFSSNIGQVILKGLLGWFALPFLLIALVITIIGIPVAAILIILIPIPIIIGLWIIGLFTGNKVLPLVKKNWEKNLLIEGVIGVSIIWLAIKAPFIGFLVLPIIAIIGLGVILDSKFGTGNPWFNKKKGDGDHVS